MATQPVSIRAIDNITLDAVVSEGHTSTLRISDNPIESGADIADHATLEPRSLAITGVVVDYEPQEGHAASSSLVGVRPAPGFLDSIPLPAAVNTTSPAAQSYAARALTSFREGPTSQAAAPGAGLGTRPQREIAPWMTGGQVTNNADSSGTGDRLQRVYDSLLALQKSGKTVTITTGLRRYDNMLLQMVAATQDQDGSAQISINAREIFIVTSRTVSGVRVAGTSKSGRAGSQAADKADRGKTQPQESSDTSLLGKIKGAVGGDH